jgi:L-seryl-tRNA(Ser) seleniumtransferase
LSDAERSGDLGAAEGAADRGASAGAATTTDAASTRTDVGAAPTARPPSVERLLAAVRPRRPSGQEHEPLVAAAREILAEERGRLSAGEPPASFAALGDRLVARLDGWSALPAIRAINATGVIVHTNLGRSPWPDAAVEAAAAAAHDYVLLEIDRATGRRGARFRMAEEHLVALTGGEDALVTNNNAAALGLAVALAGRGRGVVVSRGELVEIGGGVRIPEIVRRAGAKLIEVGTTNRTRAADFEPPLASGAASIVLRVHPSNFRQEGFVESADPTALADLAHGHGAIVVDDLGSGALLPTERFGLAHEPTPRERLAAGADIVTFSGDKLVGGPQAGLVVGRADLVARMRRDPLARAMRPDKVTLAAVAATLGLYRAGLAEVSIPVWRMIATPIEELRERAAEIARGVGPSASVVDVRSTVGGGSLPGETLPSAAVAIDEGSPDRLLSTLREGVPPVIGRIEDGRVVLDLRTVEPHRDADVVRALRADLVSGA